VILEEGARREFSVWLGNRRIARRIWAWFPSERTIVRRLRRAL
jgi:hypothetical protein